MFIAFIGVVRRTVEGQGLAPEGSLALDGHRTVHRYHGVYEPTGVVTLRPGGLVVRFDPV